MTEGVFARSSLSGRPLRHLKNLRWALATGSTGQRADPAGLPLRESDSEADEGQDSQREREHGRHHEPAPPR